ncbi:MAG: 4-hydroxy-tetrahydrodipicolinate reductase [Granulosicoccus sp.]|nr:4-hydroxy-tetrahydrodipicolinate reductase [Granulosicoccus sp.]
MSNARRVKVAVNGAAGRMGRQLLSAVAENDDAVLCAAADAPGHSCIGLNVSSMSGGESCDVVVSDSVSDLSAGSDVIIDFTAPAVSIAVLEAIASAQTPIVIGTTGFDSTQLERLRSMAVEIPIVFAPNYSMGVTLTLSLLKQAAMALGDDYDVEIIEAHHRHKVDAPSGTAVRMGEVVADALGRNLDDCAIYGRQGITGERQTKTIGFETIRAGDIIGEHTVLFAGNGERIEITHRATDRMTFARGAVHAAIWLSDKPPGLYNMTHVLGLGEQ